MTEVLAVGAAIYTIAALEASHRSSAIGNIAGAVVVLYFLSERTRRKPSSPSPRTAALPRSTGRTP